MSYEERLFSYDKQRCTVVQWKYKEVEFGLLGKMLREVTTRSFCRVHILSYVIAIEESVVFILLTSPKPCMVGRAGIPTSIL